MGIQHFQHFKHFINRFYPRRGVSGRYRRWLPCNVWHRRDTSYSFSEQEKKIRCKNRFEPNLSLFFSVWYAEDSCGKTWDSLTYMPEWRHRNLQMTQWINGWNRFLFHSLFIYSFNFTSHFVVSILNRREWTNLMKIQCNNKWLSRWQNK